MPRSRTPTKLLDARGAFKKDPQRRRDGEPEVKDPLGAPPARLTQREVEAWQEIVERAPLGVLTAADYHAVEITARLLAESHADFAGMQTSRVARLDSLLGRFGMTPADRAKLSIEKPKDADPFDSFS